MITYYFLKITVSRHHSVPCNQCIFYCHGVPEERNCILLSGLLRVPGGEGWRKWGRERGRVGVEEEFIVNCRKPWAELTWKTRTWIPPRPSILFKRLILFPLGSVGLE